MSRRPGSILIDTNAIIECWRVGAWRALAGGYAVETVEECVTETQTGYQRRRPEQQIPLVDLQASLSAIHNVSQAQMAAALLHDQELATLDLGERTLWAHALARSDTWVLCGPDKASLRFGVRNGFRNRLAALEKLLDGVGFRPRIALKLQHTSKWTEATLGEFALAEASKRS